MQNNEAIRRSALVMYGGLGALMGIVVAGLLLATNAFGFGSMIHQVEQSITHLFLMFFKPAMLFGAIGIGLSMMRQLGLGRNVSSLG